jgi:ketosteroid isomerase-like protein
MVRTEKVEFDNFQLVSTAYAASARCDIPSTLSALVVDIDWYVLAREGAGAMIPVSASRPFRTGPAGGGR